MGNKKNMRWKRVKAKKLEAQSGKCFYCDVEVFPYANDPGVPNPLNGITLDHLEPRYGRPTRSAMNTNTVVACWGCNQDKATQNWKLFLFKQQSKIMLTP